MIAPRHTDGAATDPVAAVDDALTQESAAAPGPPTLAPVSRSTEIVLFGTLAWLGALWVLVAVLYAVAIGAISIWGSLEDSLWSQAVAGWQRWPVAAAGFTAVSSFGPMLVTNGVTRARAAQAFIATAIGLAVLGALYVVVGFGVESIVFDNNAWTHAVDEIRFFDDVGLPRVGLSFAFVFAAYYVAGWLLTLAVRRLGWFAVFALPLAAIPVLVCELALMVDGPGTQFDVVDERMSTSTSLWVGSLVSLVALVVAYWAAARLTRDLTVDT